MKRFAFLLLILPACYAGWLGMLLTHEAGHVLHARLSGGVVERVSIPLFGYSQTHLAANPSPKFVAWGGPVWGCVIPLILLATVIRTPRRVRQAMQFFAGFCLVTNGVYLGIGWTDRVGDAGDLVRLGTPVWMLMVFGICATAAGMLIWHRLGRTEAA